ncbi:hypothetical protein F0310_05500, partial (plasmid) [Borrelia sp. A-FGy1]
MFTLIISTVSKLLFLTCKFFRNNSTSKESPLLVAASNAMITVDTTDNVCSTSYSTTLEKKETKDKLSKDDKDKLKSFFSKTKTYQSSLDSIYDKYISSYRTIDTYT